MPLREMGLKGREWMRNEFSWEGRARQMLDCYAGVRGTSGTAATELWASRPEVR